MEEIRPLACQERGCEMTVWGEDPATLLTRYQHGPNPEHMLEVSYFERGVVRIETARMFWWRWSLGERWITPPAVVDDWVERVHAYEDQTIGETEG